MLKAAQARSAFDVRNRFSEMPCDYWAAHNASFDAKFFTPKTGRWICTMKAAQAIYPDAPSHKNQILRYWLDLDDMMDGSRYGEAHRAGFDTYVTACLLAKMILANKMTLNDIANLYDKPSTGGVIPFGKHKGMPWNKLPRSYVVWLSENTKDDEIREKCRLLLK
jgi:exodeoxyribonuclease X